MLLALLAPRLALATSAGLYPNFDPCQAYVPGQPMKALFLAVQYSGFNNLHVEDSFPSGWTVTNIQPPESDPPVPGKVVWDVPLAGGASQWLKFTVTPPPTATGTATFTYSARFGGDSGSQPIEATHQQVPPVTLASCQATVPSTGTANLAVGFTGQAALAPDDCTYPVAYDWDFGDSSDHSSTPSPSHTYTSAGTFTWTMAASLGASRCTKTGTITIKPGGCSLRCSANANPTSGSAPLAVSLTGTATASNCQGAPTYDWDFGDTSPHSSQQAVNHTYPWAGTYPFKLTVRADDQTCSQGGTVVVSPTSTAPPISAPGSYVYIVSASAHTAGAAGTNWLSDMVLHNPGQVAANVALYLLKGGTDNTAAQGVPGTVPGGQSVRLGDVVGTVFAQSAPSGAVLVGSDRELAVTSRTYNTATTGTFGQYIEGYLASRAFGSGEQVRLIGLAKNAHYRTNVGFASASGSSTSITTTVYRSDGTLVGAKATTLQPYGWAAENKLIDGLTTADVDDAYAVVTSATPGARYYTYASVIDQDTGDPVQVVPVGRSLPVGSSGRAPSTGTTGAEELDGSGDPGAASWPAQAVLHRVDDPADGSASSVPTVAYSFIPSKYTPGGAVSVRMLVTQDPAGQFAQITDNPPTGWTVDSTSLSPAGGTVSGTATVQVKWNVPLAASASQMFSYRVTPPSGATGTQTFAGSVQLSNDATSLGWVALYREIGQATPCGPWAIIRTASSANPSLGSIARSPAAVMAVGYDGTILRSTDLVTWSPRWSSAGTHLGRVIWTGTQFVAVGYGGTVLTSPDGLTWTSRVSNVSSSEYLWGIVQAGNRMVAVGGSLTSTDPGTAVVVTSDDGAVTWARRAVGNATLLRNVAWSGSKYVAVGNYGSILTSSDGTTWSYQQQESLNLWDVTWASDRFVAVGYDTILTSTDSGVTWTSKGGDNRDFLSVLWTGSQILAAGFYSGVGVLRSTPDWGTTWQDVLQENTTTSFTDVVMTSQEMFLTGTKGIIERSVCSTSYQLTVSRSGSGSGSVTSSPAGIDCGSSCSAAFAGGTAVTLTATPSTGSAFTGWSGDCTGTGACSVTMSQARAVTATFTSSPSYALTVTRSGSGTVTSSPSGINCGTTCAASFVSPTQVTLTATPGSGYVFGGWSGDCSGTGTCTVTMNQARSVTATFTPLPSYTLTVTKSGSGTVTSSPSGINCGTTCSAAFVSPTQVSLTATPGSGYTFAGWTGDCTGTGVCSLTMSQARSVTATFTLLQCSLTCSATATPSAGQAPLLVSMQASATTSNCSGTVSFDWSFGDGSAHSSSQSPTHTYSAAGTFTWTMTAAVQGTTCSKTGTVAVSPDCVAPPAPALTAPATATSGVAYSLAWTATSADNSYDVQESTDASFANATSASVTGTSRSVSHIAATGTTWYSRVRARLTCGGSSHLSPWSAAGSTLVNPVPVPIYVPAGAHVTGAAGTNWRTNLEIHNPGNTQAAFSVALLKRDVDNTAPDTKSFLLLPQQSRRYEDVLSDPTVGFNFTGAATLRVTATSGTLMVTGRTYNLMVAGNPLGLPVGSTFGQFIPGLPESQAVPYGREARLVQLSHSADANAGFRTNLGLVNATGIPITVNVALYRGNGTLLGQPPGFMLLPYSFRQIDKIFASVTTQDVVDGFAVLGTTTPNGAFFAYASVIDNRSGDPIFVPVRIIGQ